MMKMMMQKGRCDDVTDLEAVGLDGCQEGRQANLALQVQAYFSRAHSQPLSSQLQPHTITQTFWK